jgi:FMN phosphatase YigB (HAD superfamily)
MPTAFVPSFKKYYKDFIALADAMVISGEEKMYKPQRRIYRLMTKRLNVEPEEICFFDDVEANCESARSCGWKAIRFTDVAQAMREFEGLGVRS